MDGEGSELLKWITKAKKMEVPFFQRPYVWENKNFEDLIDSFNDTPDNYMPFFGSVIMKEIGTDEYLELMDNKE